MDGARFGPLIVNVPLYVPTPKSFGFTETVMVVGVGPTVPAVGLTAIQPADLEITNVVEELVVKAQDWLGGRLPPD